MTTPTFKTGQIVYDKHRNAGKYLYEVEGGHVVYPIAWGEEDDLTLDRSIWREVFSEPPAPDWKPWAVAVLIVAVFWGYFFRSYFFS